jgi:hypothetical protein
MKRKQFDEVVLTAMYDAVEEVFGDIINDGIMITQSFRDRAAMDLQGSYNVALLIKFTTPSLVPNKPVKFIKTNINASIHDGHRDNVVAIMHSTALDVISQYERVSMSDNQVLWSKRVIGYPHFRTIEVPKDTIGLALNISKGKG